MKLIRSVSNILKLYQDVYFSSTPPVLIYQMGKVGSSSIEKSLKKIHYTPCYHVHRLNPQNIRAVQQEYAHKRLRYDQWQTDRRALFLYKHIIQKKCPAKIISLVREPVSRNLSAYFQNFYRFTGEAFQQEQNYDIQELIDTFIQEYNHDVPLAWFDKEFLPVLDTDIYHKTFDKQRGFIRYQKEEKDIIVLKCELSDDDKSLLLKEFLHRPDFEIVRANVSKEKNYSAVYKAFLDAVRLPEKYIDRLYSSRYTKHFYSDDEIASLREKWLNRV